MGGCGADSVGLVSEVFVLFLVYNTFFTWISYSASEYFISAKCTS